MMSGIMPRKGKSKLFQGLLEVVEWDRMGRVRP